MSTFVCSRCGNSWPENYCPECKSTIGHGAMPPPIPELASRGSQRSAPPPIPVPVPVLKVPPLLNSSGFSFKKTFLYQSKLYIPAGLFFGAILIATLYTHIRYYDFPASYRNKPALPFFIGWGSREFDQANVKLGDHDGPAASGNSEKAIEIAAQFSKTFKAERDEFFTHGFFEKIGIPEGEFQTYCELHEDKCAFLVYVPGLRHYEKDPTAKEDARASLATVAWLTAQAVLRGHRAGNPNMELAVGLRGISQYGPITLGYYVDNPSSRETGGIVKKLDADNPNFLWPFFAPGTNSPPAKP